MIDPSLAARIASAPGFIFDMDGTLALGDRASGGHVALPGAVEMLATLRAKGVPYCVFTNGSAKPPAAYAATLRAAGLDVTDGEMMTPSSVAADYLARQRVKRVRVLGTEGSAAPLADIGLEVVGPSEKAAGIDAVYTAWFRDFTLPHLEIACADIWAGARLTTASHVPFFATQGGRGIGTSFAMNAVVKALTGKRPKILGKPSLEALRFALRLLRLPARAANRIVIVGDDPALEMRMANRGGALGIGMTTGIHDRASFAAVPTDQRPSLVLDNFEPLLDLLAR